MCDPDRPIGRMSNNFHLLIDFGTYVLKKPVNNLDCDFTVRSVLSSTYKSYKSPFQYQWCTRSLVICLTLKVHVCSQARRLGTNL